jgi:hypothetical protein
MIYDIRYVPTVKLISAKASFFFLNLFPKVEIYLMKMEIEKETSNKLR